MRKANPDKSRNARLPGVRVTMILLALLAGVVLIAVLPLELRRPLPWRPPPFSAVVRIPDPGVVNALRQTTGNLTGPIQVRQLQDVESLHIGHVHYPVGPGKAIRRPATNLAGLQRCANLRKLSLSYVELTDSAVLSQLSRLESLTIDKSRVHDLKGVLLCRRLRELNVDFLLGDLPSLNNLQRLEVLAIGPVDDDDLRSIRTCRTLKELRLHGDLGEDLGPLANLTDLRILALERHQTPSFGKLGAVNRFAAFDHSSSDIAPLRGLTKLRILRLMNNGIEDIAPLQNLTELHELLLGCNRITDVSPLGDLGNLRVLFLESNRISDVGPLAELTNLQWLSLGQNEISDIRPLSRLVDLRALRLDRNRIEDVTPLARLFRLGDTGLIEPDDDRVQVRRRSRTARRYRKATRPLITLDLSHNAIASIEPLVRNDGLGEGDRLDLKANLLSDAAYKLSIPALQDRGVVVAYSPKPSGNIVPIADEGLRHAVRQELEHIRGLSRLRWLALRGTRIGDAGLRHLRNLNDLESLYLQGTNGTEAGIEALREALPSSARVVLSLSRSVKEK